MKTFAIASLGCKVNSYESDLLVSMFEAHDYLQVDFKTQPADVYLINTCTVTNTGAAKSRKLIRQAISRNEKAIVCVLGCYAQISSQEIAQIPGVDIIVGTQYRHQLVEMVEQHTKNQQIIKVADIMETSEFEEFGFKAHPSHQRAYLKIQEGCNNFCTYCIIPYARGQMRSRSKELVIAEAQQLVLAGYQEIILTGIHTGGYGIDLDNYSFTDLVSDLLKEVPQLVRLRISSLEINQISDRLLKIMKTDSRLAPHLHIPLQSGSQKILELMKRKYTKQEFLDKIKNIRAQLPNIALTTDLIVGFPGETAELFTESYDFVQTCNFFDLHVFPYSKRTGTPAAAMINQVAEKTKKERVEKMMVLASKQRQLYINKFIEKNLEVIVEEYDQKLKLYYGHSANYLKVYFKGPAVIGTLVNIKLLENKNYPLGEVIINE